MTENHVEIMMSGQGKKLSSYGKFRIFIWLSIGFLLLSWLFDSILDSVIFHEGTLFEQILKPSDREIAVRLLFAFILVLFSGYAQININKLKSAHESLKMAIEKAEEEKNKSNAIISALGDGLIIQDTEYKIVYQNQIQTDIFGNHIGEYCYKAYEGLDTICEDCPVEITFRDGKIHKTVRQVPAENGLLYIELTSSPLKDSSGKIMAGVKVVRNITEQKLADEKRRLSELKYRNLFETMAQGVVYQDAQGKITSANPAAERILGLPLDQMRGRTSKETEWKAIHEDGKEFPGETHPSMVALRTGKEVRDVVMGVFNPAEDEYKWINVHAVPQFKPGENRAYQVYTIFENITGRRNAEKALQESEARYRDLFDSSPISLWEEDFSDVKKYIDSLKSKGIKNFETYFEAHPEEVLKCAAMVKVLNVNMATVSLFKARDKEDFSKGLSEIFSPHSYDVFREELIEVSEGKTSFEGEDVLKSFTGNLIPVYLKWSIAQGHEYTNSKRLVSIVDITERKQIEDKLRLFSYAVEEAADGIQIVDMSGHIFYSNRAVEEMYGFSREELTGKDVNEMNVDREFAFKVIIPAVQKTGRWSGELLVNHKDGSAFPIWLTASVVKDNKRMPIAMIGIIKDITERKRAEEAIKKYTKAIEESNRIKELFIDIMHHDLLNPLSTARGFIELLNEDETEDKKKKYLKTVERNLAKSLELIDSATKLSKLESSKTLKLEKLDLSEVVEEVIKNFAPLAAKAGMNIENKITQSMPVKANKIIEEVFVNFISNAIKYASSGKKIVINCEETEDRWKIRVIDWGECIKDNDKEWIFERFSRKEKKGVKGSGLGLAIAKKIVELHMGRIWVEDNPEGGSVFSVEIPKDARSKSFNAAIGVDKTIPESDKPD